MNKNIWYIIIFVIGIILGFFLNHRQPSTNTIVTTDTIYNLKTDTITITKWRVKEKILPNDTIKIIEAFDSTQLLEIAKQYYTTNLYDSTLQGAECTLDFSAAIFQNDFLFTNFRITNNRPTAINKSETTVYSNKLSTGVQIQGNATSFDAFGVVSYKRRKVSYGALYSPLTKTAGIKIEFDIL